MLLSTIIFAAMAYRVPVQKRLFHILTTLITAFATLSYFAMATGSGNSFTHVVVRHSHKNGHNTIREIFRQVFYARYIDWSLTTPLLLLDLAILAGVSGANILVAIVADVIMILTGLFAAYGKEGGQKWAWYAMACVAFLVIIYVLGVAGRRNAAARDSKVLSFFSSIGLFTLLVWTAYPIIWGIGEGARKMSVDGEIIAYAILDILAKPVFGFWLLMTHERLPSSHVNLDGVWTHGFGKREGVLRVGDDDDA
jgi:bacteriorhodopsin